MADDSTQDGDEVVDATPERVLGVIDRMRTLPWPEDSDDTLEWVIDGLEGNTSFFAHLLVLGATSDATRLAALTMPVATLADERWGARQHFDATLFTDDADTDPAEYDRRSALASLVRALGSDKAIWWPRGPEAVVLIDNSDVAPEVSKAAVLVLPAEWLRGSGAEEQALRDPPRRRLPVR